ncbi:MULTISPECIES: hypothetical protein [unclassified Duganella]|uniref:hypothetical protein n=1 Tax=unclassified Duganella TaxID=2636909 RepID=UPI0006FBE370|nr:MULTISPECIES: hypothetical protein [unclassified Duganella]KQV47789.1 hypothetical protein ASD07_12765 [Duganella sp. Root336D2]KRB81924.1 hypothetical protein ASE26_13505 [Duganella sp. Root198D2]
MRAVSLAAFAVCLVAGSAHAHVDTILTLRPDGSMPELPAQYANARLQIGWPVARKGVTLRVNGRAVSVPLCALAGVKSRSLAQVDLSGSWYHLPRDGLPHYLMVGFRGPHQPKGGLKQEGVMLMFDLTGPAILHAPSCASAAGRK